MKRLVVLVSLVLAAACGGSVRSTPPDDAGMENPDGAVDATVPVAPDASVDAEPPVPPPPPGSAVQEAVEFVGGAGSLQAGGYQVDVTIGHAIDPAAVTGGNIRVESGAPQSAH
jgi:hypothetical protein